jgi:hypothetical protein
MEDRRSKIVRVSKHSSINTNSLIVCLHLKCFSDLLSSCIARGLSLSCSTLLRSIYSAVYPSSFRFSILNTRQRPLRLRGSTLFTRTLTPQSDPGRRLCGPDNSQKRCR